MQTQCSADLLTIGCRLQRSEMRPHNTITIPAKHNIVTKISVRSHIYTLSIAHDPIQRSRRAHPCCKQVLIMAYYCSSIHPRLPHFDRLYSTAAYEQSHIVNASSMPFSSTPSITQIHDTCVIRQRWNSHAYVCMCHTLCNAIHSFLETFGMMFGTQGKSKRAKTSITLPVNKGIYSSWHSSTYLRAVECIESSSTVL